MRLQVLEEYDAIKRLEGASVMMSRVMAIATQGATGRGTIHPAAPDGLWPTGGMRANAACSLKAPIRAAGHPVCPGYPPNGFRDRTPT